jgi:hypothetical protein
MGIGMLLMILAVICLVLAAFGVSVRSVSLGWLGMAFWALSLLV